MPASSPRFLPCNPTRHLGGLLLAALLAMFGLAAGCGGKKPAPAGPPVLFPQPPAKPRVQYLGSVTSQADLPATRGSFAEFVLGPPPHEYPIVKPIAAVMHDTRLFVCDTMLNTVLVYDLASGQARKLRGDRASGKIEQPNNIALDADGRLYVADRQRQAVLVYATDESFVTAFGHPGEAKPVAVAVAGDEIVVCDRDEHEIEVWSRTDGSVIRRFGGLGNEPGKFLIPTMLALDDAGHVYVTDTGNFRVQKLTLTGEHVATYGGPGRGFGQFAWPKGIGVDAHRRLFVADSRFANIQIFDEAGHLLLFFAGPGPDAGNFDLPAGITVMPWTDEVPWLHERLMPGFHAESLVIAVSQQGKGFINFFAVAHDAESEVKP